MVFCLRLIFSIESFVTAKIMLTQPSFNEMLTVQSVDETVNARDKQEQDYFSVYNIVPANYILKILNT